MNNKEIRSFETLIEAIILEKIPFVQKEGRVTSITNDIASVQLLGEDTIIPDLINKSAETLDIGDRVLIEGMNNNLGNAYIKTRFENNVFLSGTTPSAAGADTYIQYNNSGILGADSNFKWDGNILTLKDALVDLTSGMDFKQTDTLKSITWTVGQNVKITLEENSLDIEVATNINGDLDVTGDIIVSGTVDGRDVAADGTKLDLMFEIHKSTSEPTSGDGVDGDIWMVYTA